MLIFGMISDGVNDKRWNACAKSGR